MPVNRFSVGALNGATPGLSRMAQALAGGGGAYQAGYDGELQGQSKMAQAIAAARASEAAARNSDATARFNDEKAASEGAGRRVLESRPDLYEEQVAAASGTDIPLVRALRTQLRTGQAPVAPMGPPTEDGQMGAAPMQIDPAKASKITMALQSLLPLLANTGDLNPAQMADARSTDRTSALSDAIIAGTANRNTVAGAQAAAAGKNQYNSDATGAVLDLFGGQLDTANPMAQGTINLRKEQAGAQKANAAQSYASAGASNASRDKTRAEIGELNAGTGKGGKAPSGYRWAANGNLEMIPGGPADPANKTGAVTEDERKAAGWVDQAQFAFNNMQKVLKKDPKAAKPNILAEAAGAIPWVGDAARNTMNSEARQQFEQAAKSFAEAALRAATGAGVNRDEAIQKVQELTPQIGDQPGTIEQKKEALSVYLGSLRSRAGRALPSTSVPQAPPRNVTVEW